MKTQMDDSSRSDPAKHSWNTVFTSVISLLGFPLIIAAVVFLSTHYSNARTRVALSPQCFKPSEVSCDFYPSCLEERFQCGSDGYPIGYGQKYCERFMTLNTPYSISSSLLSAEGLRWRNSTLLCLQRELVAPIQQGPERLSCDQLQRQAFDSHPPCYTQPGASMCSLPLNDWRIIAGVVDFGDYASMDSVRQVKDVLITCATSLKLELKEANQNLLQARLTRLPSNPELRVQILNRTRDLQDHANSLRERLEFISELKKERSAR